MTLASVSVVVVTWNGLGLTERCLDSLAAQETRGRAVEVVVVDNGSTDGTVEALRRRAGVRVVALDRNTGFAGGVDAGIEATTGDVVVLLNNDATAEPGFLDRIAAPFDRPAVGGARLGAVTGRVLLRGRFRPAAPGEAGLVDHAGRAWVRTPDADGLRLLNSTGNEVTRSGNGRDRGWLADAGEPAPPARVFGFNGGCAALLRAAVQDVGPLDASSSCTTRTPRCRGGCAAGAGRSPTCTTRSRSTTTPGLPAPARRSSRTTTSGTASWSRSCTRPSPWSPGPPPAALARAVLGPDRRRRARVLGRVLAAAPAALRRRRAVDRAATVPRAAVAALLVPDGAVR